MKTAELEKGSHHCRIGRASTYCELDGTSRRFDSDLREVELEPFWLTYTSTRFISDLNKVQGALL
jgi:hypothetical protein